MFLVGNNLRITLLLKNVKLFLLTNKLLKNIKLFSLINKLVERETELLKNVKL